MILPYAIYEGDKLFALMCPVARHHGAGFGICGIIGDAKGALMCRDMFYNRIKHLLRQNRSN